MSDKLDIPGYENVVVHPSNATTIRRKIEELFCDECAFQMDCIEDHDKCHIYNKALELHQWTDQQRIDKTIKWLEEQDFGGWIESETEDLINDFKQSVKEEL